MPTAMVATTKPAKAVPRRTMRFDAATRVLRVAVGKVVEVYHLHDVPSMSGTFRVRFVKHADGSKRTATLTASGNCFCDCQAGYYGKPCRHASALLTLAKIGAVTAPTDD